MTAEYWDGRYADIGEANVSWFQPSPETSLMLIRQVGQRPSSVVDVGGGASRLVDHLLAEGCHDVTVVDLSQQALGEARARVGDAPVHWVVSDIRDWQPDRTFEIWHDRAAYHFLVDPEDQRHYWRLVHEAVPVGGHVVIATFAEDGPEMCSGLPVQRYSAEGLVAAMGEGFRLVESVHEQHTTPTGGQQSFVWVLAQRV